MSITVVRPGLLTTIQDLGRYGYQKYGIIVSGGMDQYSLRMANLLVGNAEGEAVQEITMMGPVLQIEAGTLLAITGGNLSPVIGNTPVPMWRPVYIQKDSVLKFGACKSGCRSYLSIAGGYNIPKIMNSKSTYLRAEVGGFHGRALQAGDVLETNNFREISSKFLRKFTKHDPEGAFSATPWYIGEKPVPLGSGATTIRVLRGGQFDQFTSESKRRFFDEEFKITSKSDRMGYRLAGPILQLAKPSDMISEATALGTVQVPADGNPILLLADRQTTGGYPKIAQVVQVDIAVVAQMKPGASVRFQEVSLREAEQLFFEREKAIGQIRTAIQLRWE